MCSSMTSLSQQVRKLTRAGNSLIGESGLYSMYSHTLELDRQLLCREERVCWFCAIGSGPRVNEHVRAEGERHDSLTPAFSLLHYSLIHLHMHAHNQHSSLFHLQKAGLQSENENRILLICFVHIQADLIINFIK